MEFIKKFSILMFLVLGCGSNLNPRIAPENNVIGLQVSEALVSDINDNTFIIPAILTKPRIFIFATELCSTCQSEHRALRDIMAAHAGALPSNVDIYTIMVDAVDSADATGFKLATGIQWNPYYQTGDALKKSLCGEMAVYPCVVIELPIRGIVLQKIGEVSATELQSQTGAWLW